MNKLIKQYEQMMRASGKDLTVILAEKSPSPFASEQHLLLSETKEEWIIHSAILLPNGKGKYVVSTGSGSYLQKDDNSYADAKAILLGYTS